MEATQKVLRYLSWCDDQDPWVPPTFVGLVYHAAKGGPLDKDMWNALKSVWENRFDLAQ